MAQISLWIDTIEFARTDQAVQQCATLSTMIAAEEDKTLVSSTGLMSAYDAEFTLTTKQPGVEKSSSNCNQLEARSVALVKF